MKASEILVAAKAKIAQPENWTKGAYARDAEGSLAETNSSEAFCFCMVGALQSVDDREHHYARRAVPFLTRVVCELSPTDSWLTTFNDTHEHHEVLQAFDVAIRLAQDDEIVVETA